MNIQEKASSEKGDQEGQGVFNSPDRMVRSPIPNRSVFPTEPFRGDMVSQIPSKRSAAPVAFSLPREILDIVL